ASSAVKKPLRRTRIRVRWRRTEADPRMPGRRSRSLSMREVFAILLAAAAVASPSLAGGAGGTGHKASHLRFTTEHGLTFSEIGDVGNPGYLFDPPGPPPAIEIGGVNHRYAIMTREVT